MIYNGHTLQGVDNAEALMVKQPAHILSSVLSLLPIFLIFIFLFYVWKQQKKDPVTKKVPNIISTKGFLVSFFSGPLLCGAGYILVHKFPSIDIRFLVGVFYVIEAIIASVVLGGTRVFKSVVQSDTRDELGYETSQMQSQGHAVMTWVFMVMFVPIGGIILITTAMFILMDVIAYLLTHLF